jgi:hypothetical protein
VDFRSSQGDMNMTPGLRCFDIVRLIHMETAGKDLKVETVE